MPETLDYGTVYRRFVAYLDGQRRRQAEELRLDREDRQRHRGASDWIVFLWEQDHSPEQVTILKELARF